jgi:hypothetical protein
MHAVNKPLIVKPVAICTCYVLTMVARIVAAALSVPVWRCQVQALAPQLNTSLAMW